MHFKVEKLKNASIIPNFHLKDKKLSLKAKGLLTIMYTLPDEWDYSMTGLCTITNTGITAIRNIISELELNGYLKRKQIKNTKGQFEYEYYVFVQPQKVDITKDVLRLKRFKEHLNRI